MFSRILLLLILAASPTRALAQSLKIATVDFQSALNEVAEGEATRQRLENLFEEKRKAIEDMGRTLEAMQADYQQQALILSEATRQQKEQELYQAQMQYQQTAMQAESEMQQAYATAMEGLLARMRTVSQEIAREKGLSLVLEVTEGGVVFTDGSQDLTAELIKRYDAASSGK
ncbi:MAG: OmpH family outer membrane protein [Myxococcota bacterium]|jgi:outer membrane protein|nr:OmpH family outer membrane protein [Myxococcota bacterium]